MGSTQHPCPRSGVPTPPPGGPIIRCVSRELPPHHILEVAGCATGSTLPLKGTHACRKGILASTAQNSYVAHWTLERAETVTLGPLPRRTRKFSSCVPLANELLRKPLGRSSQETPSRRVGGRRRC